MDSSSPYPGGAVTSVIPHPRAHKRTSSQVVRNYPQLHSTLSHTTEEVVEKEKFYNPEFFIASSFDDEKEDGFSRRYRTALVIAGVLLLVAVIAGTVGGVMKAKQSTKRADVLAVGASAVNGTTSSSSSGSSSQGASSVDGSSVSSSSSSPLVLSISSSSASSSTINTAPTTTQNGRMVTVLVRPSAASSTASSTTSAVASSSPSSFSLATTSASPLLAPAKVLLNPKSKTSSSPPSETTAPTFSDSPQIKINPKAPTTTNPLRTTTKVVVAANPKSNPKSTSAVPLLTSTATTVAPVGNPKANPKPVSPTSSTTLASISKPSSTSSSSSSASYKNTAYWKATYSGVATHFPGSQGPSSALACGDVYQYPATTAFAALCHSTFDIFPGTTANALANENRSPACGPFVSGQQSLTGTWLTSPPSPNAYVVIGGDGLSNCVGTSAVKCHQPLGIDITLGGKTIRNVLIVDRNQGLGASPCSPGDVDVSDMVYRYLAGTTTSDVEAGLGAELHGVTWVWSS